LRGRGPISNLPRIVRDIHTGYSPKLKERVVKSVERLLKMKR
jgi:hypothetical protein